MAAHAELRHRRAKAGEQSEREKENRAGELPHLDAKLRRGEKVDGRQRNGDVTWSSKLQQWRRRELGFCENGGCGFGLGFPGGLGFLL